MRLNSIFMIEFSPSWGCIQSLMNWTNGLQTKTLHCKLLAQHTHKSVGASLRAFIIHLWKFLSAFFMVSDFSKILQNTDFLYHSIDIYIGLLTSAIHRQNQQQWYQLEAPPSAIEDKSSSLLLNSTYILLKLEANPNLLPLLHQCYLN